jgi:hypothetical protein
MPGRFTRDQGLTEPTNSLDHQPVATSADRRGGEHHARPLRVHHGLDDDREGKAVFVPAVLFTVGNGPRCPQRRPAVAHRREDRLLARDVEVGVVLSGERGVGEVLGGAGGSHRDRPRAQLAVRLPDRVGDRVGNRCGGDAVPKQVRRVVAECGVGAIGLGEVAAGEVVGLEEVGVRVRRDHESRRDGEPGADQLRETRSLAARQRDVTGGGAVQASYVRDHGDPSVLVPGDGYIHPSGDSSSRGGVWWDATSRSPVLQQAMK